MDFGSRTVTMCLSLCPLWLSLYDNSKSIVDFLLVYTSLCGGKRWIGQKKIKELNFLMVVNQDTSVYDFGQEMKKITSRQNSIEWQSSSFFAVPKNRSYPGMVSRWKALKPMKTWSFHSTFQRHRILLAVNQILLQVRNFLAEKRKSNPASLPNPSSQLTWRTVRCSLWKHCPLCPVFMLQKQVWSEK